MTKPHILQVGPSPEWDQEPLDKAFQMHRLFEANDRAAFLATVGPHARGITTRGELGANAAMIAACPNLEVISVCGVVYDAVDLTPAQSRGMIRAEAWVRDGSWTE
jgi:lactate dehydrogenase-like 2-hydroxyacid dehydrogenase